MANTKILKRRIRSAKNIAQITKAMEMVAASKMKRAQGQALSSRPYSTKLQGVIASLMKSYKDFKHPLIQTNSSRKTTILLISTNKSLCGGLNTNLFRFLYEWCRQNQNQDISFITVGKKGAEFVSRAGYNLQQDYSNLPEKLEFADTLTISRQLIQAYEQKEVGNVYIFYSDFVSTLVQKPQYRQLLPIDPNVLSQNIQLAENESIAPAKDTFLIPKEYLIEPDARQILTWLIPYFIELEVYHFLLEGTASEHSARMVAMKNATDNAKEIVTDLTLTFNKARQAQITAEINEVAVASLVLNYE